MAEFVNFKVRLSMKNGPDATGTISFVDKLRISLRDVSVNTKPPQTLGAIDVPSVTIADLKVLLLPSGKSSSPAATAASAPKPAPASVPIPDSDPSWVDEREYDSIRTNDFDFEANLAMFDKQSVFADFERSDTVDPSLRLVGHNRASSKPVNYANDQMIVAPAADGWDSIGTNKATKKIPAIASNGQKPAGPKVSNGRDQDTRRSIADGSDSLRLCDVSTHASVVAATPIQLLEIERAASESCGLLQQAMAEVCALHLLQLINRKILGKTDRGHNLPPFVLLLVGNSRSGLRALATGRHLTNHGMRVLAFLVPENDDSGAENNADMATQSRLYERCGGKVVTGSFEALHKLLGQLNSPVELIIDALQGYDGHLADMLDDAGPLRSLLQRLVEWCGETPQCRRILSLDIPSGIDGGSGTVQQQLLCIGATWCVSMGVPLTGLIHAYKNQHLDPTEITHYLVDVGIPPGACSNKSSLRKFATMWWRPDSVIQLQIEAEK